MTFRNEKLSLAQTILGVTYTEQERICLLATTDVVHHVFLVYLLGSYYQYSSNVGDINKILKLIANYECIIILEACIETYQFVIFCYLFSAVWGKIGLHYCL